MIYKFCDNFAENAIFPNLHEIPLPVKIKILAAVLMLCIQQFTCKQILVKKKAKQDNSLPRNISFTFFHHKTLSHDYPAFWIDA